MEHENKVTVGDLIDALAKYPRNSVIVGLRTECGQSVVSNVCAIIPSPISTDVGIEWFSDSALKLPGTIKPVAMLPEPVKPL